jgi:hypothetical protein
MTLHGCALQLHYHKTGHNLAPKLMRTIHAKHLARDLPVSQGFRKWSDQSITWEHGGGDSSRTSQWEEVDGVRHPVMVCPNRETFLDNGLPVGSFHRTMTQMIGSHRAVLACDITAEKFGGRLPRIVQVKPIYMDVRMACTCTAGALRNAVV